MAIYIGCFSAVIPIPARDSRLDFLFSIYLMGKNSIERGSRDHWTIHPQRIAAVEEAIKKDEAQRVGSGRNRGYPRKYYEMLFDPAERDPRVYILPTDQADLAGM